MAEGLPGEIAKTAHTDLLGHIARDEPGARDDDVGPVRWPQEDEHHRVPGVRVTRLTECDARGRAVATLPSP